MFATKQEISRLRRTLVDQPSPVKVSECPGRFGNEGFGRLLEFDQVSASRLCQGFWTPFFVAVSSLGQVYVKPGPAPCSTTIWWDCRNRLIRVKTKPGTKPKVRESEMVFCYCLGMPMRARSLPWGFYFLCVSCHVLITFYKQTSRKSAMSES